MPAKSKVQQKAAGAALAAKRGEAPKSSLKGPATSMYKSMSEKELDKLAHTKRSKLPARKSGRNVSGWNYLFFPASRRLAINPFTDAQLADLQAGKMYINIHSAKFPDGEIRGQVVK